MNGCIVIFRLPPKTKNVELCKFVQRFYGQDTRTGKYQYRRHGLLDDIPHRKLLRGVIIIDSKNLETVLAFLRRYNAEVHIRSIKLTVEDCQVLGFSQK